MAAMDRTWGKAKPPRHCTEARNLKVHPGWKIYDVRFEVPFDGFKAKETVRMYHRELVELLRTPGVRVTATEVKGDEGLSTGDVLLDRVTYRFGHEIVKMEGARHSTRNISARVGAISPRKLAVPPREVETEVGEGEGADPTEDERREAEGKQPKSKRAAEAELQPKPRRRRRKKDKEDDDGR